jgi:predicted DNA-binding transcriptional regulator AlpA
VLAKQATFYKHIRQGVLAASQFPPTLKDGGGTFAKPSTW